VNPVLEEMDKRGHDIAEVSLIHDDIRKRKPGFEDVDISNGDIFICSYPRIMQTLRDKKNGRIRFDHGCKKTVCIEHGVNPIAWGFPLDRHRLFDHVFVTGKWQMDAVRRSLFNYDLLPKCKMTGWPKADFLVGKGTQEVRRKYRQRLRDFVKQDFKSGPIISWVPTHGGACDMTDEILDRIGNEYNVVVAPHEGSYAAFRDGRMKMNYKEDYPYYIETDTIYDVLLASDLVITDYSSAGVEATLLNIPIIQILKDMKFHNRSEFDVLKNGHYPLSQNDDREFRLGANVSDLSILKNEVSDALIEQSDYHRKEREFWRDEIFHNAGNATKDVCDFLENSVL